MITNFGGVNIHGAAEHDSSVPKLPFIVSGTYTGNDTADRAIPHGLNRVPKMIVVIDETITTGRDMMATVFGATGDVQVFGGIPTCVTSYYGVTAADATNFHIGDTAGAWGNVSGETYLFMAI
jgi:hypothetical protein